MDGWIICFYSLAQFWGRKGQGARHKENSSWDVLAPSGRKEWDQYGVDRIPVFQIEDSIVSLCFSSSLLCVVVFDFPRRQTNSFSKVRH